MGHTNETFRAIGLESLFFPKQEQNDIIWPLFNHLQMIDTFCSEHLCINKKSSFNVEKVIILNCV